jgi:hypothetical protein
VPYVALCSKCCGIGVFPEVLSDLGILENKEILHPENIFTIQL